MIEFEDAVIICSFEDRITMLSAKIVILVLKCVAISNVKIGDTCSTALIINYIVNKINMKDIIPMEPYNIIIISPCQEYLMR